jgi:hypothetical protein
MTDNPPKFPPRAIIDTFLMSVVFNKYDDECIEYLSITEHLALLNSARAEAYIEAANTFESAGELSISLVYRDKAAKIRGEYDK